jgi:biotin carboxyl carrier protein
LKAFRVQINGESYQVSVEQIGENKFRATLGDLTFEAEGASKAGGLATWLVRGESEQIHAKAKSLSSDRMDVWLTSVPYHASVQTVGIGGYSLPESQKSTVGGQVRALMPGRITSILVREGEQVKENTPLLILEAMKMQNEITSPIHGKVKAIHVSEGETVKRDFVLVSVE